MSVQIQKKGKIIIAVLICIALFFGIRFAAEKGFIPGLKPVMAKIPVFGDISGKETVVISTDAKEQSLASNTVSTTGTEVRYQGMKWNSQMALHYANGGVKTTKGSLMEKYGVRLTFVNQDDTGIMKEDLLKFAAAYAKVMKNDPKANPADGMQFFGIMGSGAAAMAKSLEEPMQKLGLKAKILAGSPGKSLGEDKYWGPKAWKDNPQLARGSFCAVFPLDGDQDIVFLYAKQNKIPVNTDSRYFDNDAINFLEVKDFVVAGEKYVMAAEETRPEIKNGKPTGEKITKKCDSASSWTPVDETAYKQRAEWVTLASTKDYAWQMPCVIFGVDEWMKNHRDAVEGMLSAIFEGSDQIRKYPKALRFAAKVSAQAYNSENAEYWERYYKGVKVKNRNGDEVELGGSATMNLAENLYMYGELPEQRENIYKTTYTVFGEIQSKMYPRQLPDFPSFDSMIDTSYLLNVARKNTESAKFASAVDVQTYQKSGAISDVVAKGVWNTITFRSGSAEFTSEATAVLNDLKAQLSMTNNYVTIIGHTDNDGSDASNLKLGQDRADAVKNWLEEKSPGLFKNLRLESITKGMRVPVASNSTKEGKAKNRRVEIILGNK